MQKFWFENFLMRFSFVIAFLAFIGVFVYAFKLEVRRDEAAENLAFQQTVVADLGQDGLQSIPLDKPHRADRELKLWISGLISESLSIDPLRFQKVKEDVSVYFTNSGLQQYEDYLNSSGLLQNLRERQNKMHVFLEEQPLLLNSSEVGGIYRWLYQVPVTLSFIPRDSNGSPRDLVNRKISLRVQIRRVPVGDAPYEMQVESWNVSSRR